MTKQNRNKKKEKKPLWTLVTEKMEDGQSLVEATANTPLAIKQRLRVTGPGRTVQVSLKQQRAIKRSYNG